ncbi:radical SAM protein [Brachyspira pilosicoli]|uniref:Radical SAM protein n=1 Tax=Brachyspira pilosicoli TaxID=52584 RepID=A0A5C8EBT9_BRAPL|nr:radical SAM protein [Brachyspira pilosicoli]TXJ35246.1 radical SAM protein [Brachyspira pilosicoli]
MTEKIIHFSIDDCIEMFRDITINDYSSLFESKYFSFFKQLNEKYKACISLYIFIEYNNFNICKTTDKFKNEFIENSHWLKIGFHGYNENSNHVHNPKKAIKDYSIFLKEVYRFAGTYDIIDHIPRLHYYSGDLENLLNLKKIKHGIIGALSADDDRLNYYLNKNENIFLNNQFIYKDIVNDLLFVKTTIRVENIKDLSSVISSINLNENIILFTHERFLDDKNIRSNIIKIYEYALENNYSANFIERNNILNDFKIEKIKKFIDCYIPVTACNLRCEYCYITQTNRWSDTLPDFKYSPQYVRKALSKERLGGTCLLNMCAGGETLLHPYIIELLRELLEEGHYIWIITNGTLNKRFNEILKFPKELLYRLAFKFSFHYLQLKQLNNLDLFVDNVINVKKAGCSFSVEITPHDELIKYIDEIKEFSIKKFGALPHITVARKDNDKDKEILTNFSKKQYNEIWSIFNSKMFSFKLSTFQVKRKEFCYAGKWTYSLNMGNGLLKQCYSSFFNVNIFDDINTPIKEESIGKKCLEPHCYNSHAFLTFGTIPKLRTPFYYEMRNRVAEDGSEWLNPYMKEFCSHKLKENNTKNIFILREEKGREEKRREEKRREEKRREEKRREEKRREEKRREEKRSNI